MVGDGGPGRALNGGFMPPNETRWVSWQNRGTVEPVLGRVLPLSPATDPLRQPRRWGWRAFRPQAALS